MTTRFFAMLLLLVGAFSGLTGQIEDPVSWTFEHEETGENEYLLKFIATIEDGWYVYSQDIEPGGPVPTSFSFKERKSWSRLDENVQEIGKVYDAFDPIFEMQVKKYKEQVVFQTRVKTKKKTGRITGELEFMTCDDSKCLPPATEKFSFIVGRDKSQKDDSQVTDSVVEDGNAALPIDGTEATSSKNSGFINPVKWSFDWVELEEEGTFEMRVNAKIQENWHVYSQDNKSEDGPEPTVFHFEDNSDIEWLDDEVLESGKLKEGIDPVFKVHVKKFADKLTFKRRVKLLNPDAVIEGRFEYMTCDDSQCQFPPPIPFEFGIGGPKEVLPKGGEIVGGLPPFLEWISDCGNVGDDEKSMWMIFILGFLGGLAALLTPCVFPMIPLTVSFFTKQSDTRAKGIRNAIIYALSIIFIYVSMGLLVTITFGADALNALSTNPWFNIGFFVLFTVFAISFFGYFEITLPSWLINKSDAASERGGLIGIFFMAFTLALVSFSCTGPIIGTLLVDAAIKGDILGPAIGMFGFALALALPFALFALFPSWLNSLPRSGGWLNSVKVVLGFVELIFAIKFLSNADLVMQWGFLKRETFLVIWMILLLAMAAYLFGLIRFPHDSPGKKKLGFPRIGLGVASVAFAFYLIPGIFCSPLSLTAGFPPPTFYSYGCPVSEGDLHGIENLGDGRTKSIKESKPILVDFTGWACVNCRKMEENVWPEVADIMNEYTLVSLYVDEKLSLPDEQKIWVEVQGRKWQLLTVGNQWSYAQQRCFLSNSQPYYVAMTSQGELLSKPVGYTPKVPEYTNWLLDGLRNFESIRKSPSEL